MQFWHEIIRRFSSGLSWYKLTPPLIVRNAVYSPDIDRGDGPVTDGGEEIKQSADGMDRLPSDPSRDNYARDCDLVKDGGDDLPDHLERHLSREDLDEGEYDIKED